MGKNTSYMSIDANDFEQLIENLIAEQATANVQNKVNTRSWVGDNDALYQRSRQAALNILLAPIVQEMTDLKITNPLLDKELGTIKLKHKALKKSFRRNFIKIILDLNDDERGSFLEEFKDILSLEGNNFVVYKTIVIEGKNEVIATDLLEGTRGFLNKVLKDLSGKSTEQLQRKIWISETHENPKTDEAPLEPVSQASSSSLAASIASGLAYLAKSCLGTLSLLATVAQQASADTEDKTRNDFLKELGFTVSDDGKVIIYRLTPYSVNTDKYPTFQSLDDKMFQHKPIPINRPTGHILSDIDSLFLELEVEGTTILIYNKSNEYSSTDIETFQDLKSNYACMNIKLKFRALNKDKIIPIFVPKSKLQAADIDKDGLLQDSARTTPYIRNIMLEYIDKFNNDLTNLSGKGEDIISPSGLIRKQRYYAAHYYIESNDIEGNDIYTVIPREDIVTSAALRPYINVSYGYLAKTSYSDLTLQCIYAAQGERSLDIISNLVDLFYTNKNNDNIVLFTNALPNVILKEAYLKKSDFPHDSTWFTFIEPTNKLTSSNCDVEYVKTLPQGFQDIIKLPLAETKHGLAVYNSKLLTKMYNGMVTAYSSNTININPQSLISPKGFVNTTTPVLVNSTAGSTAGPVVNGSSIAGPVIGTTIGIIAVGSVICALYYAARNGRNRLRALCARGASEETSTEANLEAQNDHNLGETSFLSTARNNHISMSVAV